MYLLFPKTDNRHIINPFLNYLLLPLHLYGMKYHSKGTDTKHTHIWGGSVREIFRQPNNLQLIVVEKYQQILHLKPVNKREISLIYAKLRSGLILKILAYQCKYFLYQNMSKSVTSSRYLDPTLSLSAVSQLANIELTSRYCCTVFPLCFS